MSDDKIQDHEIRLHKVEDRFKLALGLAAALGLAGLFSIDKVFEARRELTELRGQIDKLRSEAQQISEAQRAAIAQIAAESASRRLAAVQSEIDGLKVATRLIWGGQSCPAGYSIVGQLLLGVGREQRDNFARVFAMADPGTVLVNPSWPIAHPFVCVRT